MYGGVKPCERSKNMGEDTLILGHGGISLVPHSDITTVPRFSAYSACRTFTNVDWIGHQSDKPNKTTYYTVYYKRQVFLHG